MRLSSLASHWFGLNLHVSIGNTSTAVLVLCLSEPMGSCPSDECVPKFQGLPVPPNVLYDLSTYMRPDGMHELSWEGGIERATTRPSLLGFRLVSSHQSSAYFRFSLSRASTEGLPFPSFSHAICKSAFHSAQPFLAFSWFDFVRELLGPPVW